MGIALLALLPPRWCQRGLLVLATLDLVFTLQPFRIRSVNPLDLIANAGSLRDQTRAVVVGNGRAAGQLRPGAAGGPASRFCVALQCRVHDAVDRWSQRGRRHGHSTGDDPALRLLGYAIIIDPDKHLVTVVEPAPPRAWVAHCVWPGTAIQVRAADFPRESCITRRAATTRDATVPPPGQYRRGRQRLAVRRSGWAGLARRGRTLVSGLVRPGGRRAGGGRGGRRRAGGPSASAGPHLIDQRYVPVGSCPDC